MQNELFMHHGAVDTFLRLPLRRAAYPLIKLHSSRHGSTPFFSLTRRSNALILYRPLQRPF